MYNSSFNIYILSLLTVTTVSNLVLQYILNLVDELVFSQMRVDLL